MENKKRIQKIKVSLFLIIVGLVVYVFWNQFPPIIKEIKDTDYKTIILISIMGLMYQFFEGLSIREISKTLGSKISPIKTGGCSLYSAFYRVITFGSATYISVLHYLKKQGLSPSKGFSVSILNYMGQKIAVVLMAIVMYFSNYSFMEEYFKNYQKYLLFGILFTTLVVVVLILICISEKFHKLILMIFKLDKKGKFKSIEEKLKDNLILIRHSTKDLLVDKVLIFKIIFLNILKLSCWYVIPYIIFYNQYNYSFLDYVSITALAIALIGVVPAPGAMGSTEFIFGLLFANLMDINKAMSGVFLYRFANFIIPTIFGGLVALKMGISSRTVKK